MSYITTTPSGTKRVNSDRPPDPLSPQKRALIHGAIRIGEMSATEIALAFGVSDRTVYRMRKELRP